MAHTAETLRELLSAPLKGCFTTVHVAGQFVGEVERTFYEEFKEELAEHWLVYDSKGLHQLLTVNYDDDVPTIVDGWMPLREHYNFIGHHEIFFKYLGNKQFQIIPNMNRVTPDAFPTWHSESRGLRKAMTYQITMTEDPNQNPILELPTEMGDYLADTSLDQLFLVGENHEKVRCSLDYQDNPFRVIIEMGWPECVRTNGFQVGDVILFSMRNIYQNHMIHVTKKTI